VVNREKNSKLEMSVHKKPLHAENGTEPTFWTIDLVCPSRDSLTLLQEINESDDAANGNIVFIDAYGESHNVYLSLGRIRNVNREATVFIAPVSLREAGF